jgi:acetylornithine deacetylase/succinyl-diaminopimelate desuccinylase-like protein
VARAAAGARGTVDIEVYQSAVPGALTPLDHPLVRSALAAREAVLGEPQTRMASEQLAIGNDGRQFASRGVPFVKYGPGRLASGPRINVEEVEIAQLVQATEIYSLIALDFVEQGR